MSEFIHWLSEVEVMEDRMEELRFTGIKKYQMLRYRLEGQARQCTRIDFPNNESYDRAMNLLKDRYYDKALAMREWYRKLKNVPKIPEENHVKINQATTEILNLIEGVFDKSFLKLSASIFGFSSSFVRVKIPKLLGFPTISPFFHLLVINRLSLLFI